jgi:hypothetical protein
MNNDTISTNMPTVTMSTLDACLEEMINLDMATFIWGPPGIGKTAVPAQVTKRMGIGLRVNSFNSMETVDVNGLPVPDLETLTTRWLKPEFIPQVERDGPRGVWFLDEANTVSPAMMPVLFRIVQERMAGTHPIPQGWVPVLAGNRAKDRASAQRMPTPLRNKLAHFNVEADVDSWVKWAIPAGISPYLIAFLRFRKDLIHKMPATDDVNTFPTPRAWEKVSSLIGKPRELRQHLISAIVGDGPAAEVEGFLRVFSTLPKIDEAIANPKTCALPPQSEPASCYAMAMALARSATRQNLQSIMTYVERFTTHEFSVVAIVDAVRRDPSLTQTSAYGVWAVANQEVAL